MLTKRIGHSQFKKVKTIFGEYENIPFEWDVVRLEELAANKTAIKMGPFGSSLKKAELVESGLIKTIWIENVVNNEFTWNYQRFITKDKYEELKGFSVTPDDVLITMAGTIGRVAVVPKDIGQAIISSHLLKITLNKERCLPQYLYYYLMSRFVVRQLIRESRGIVMEGLNTGIIKSILTMLPGIEEQQEIASILSTIDDLLEKKAKIIEQMQWLKKGLMQRLLTRGVGHTRFRREVLGLRFLDLEIPVSWEIVQIKDITQSLVPGRNKPTKFDGDIPWITISDLVGMSTSTSKEGLKLTREEIKRSGGKAIPPQSVIMTCVGEFGIVSIAANEMVLNQQLHAYVCSERIEPYFLALSLMFWKKYMDSVATKTTIPYMNKDNCERIPIILPPIAEQQKIIQVLSMLETYTEMEVKNNYHLQNLKQGLMQKLLTGQIRVKV